MKLVSYTHAGRVGWGVAVAEGRPDAGVVPIDGALAGRYPTLGAMLTSDAQREIAAAVKGKPPALPLSTITFRPPLHEGGKIVCIGVNYPKRHPVDGEVPPPKDISLFIKMPSALVGHGAALHHPGGEPGKTFDYEGELVMVIGKAGRHISKERAMEHVAGYTIMNDGSVRGWQKHSVAAGKNFDASGALGPWVVTADEIPDPKAMRLSTRLNGEQVQSTTVGAMIFDLPALIAYVSGFTRLEPGDIISTGSPDGAGGSRVPQRFLVPGDKLEIEWSGIGTLSNHVVAAGA